MKQIQNVHRGIPTLARGFHLLKKKEKTDEEQKAAASFSKMVSWTLILSVFGIFVMFLLLFLFVPNDPGTARTGIRNGDEIVFPYQNISSFPYTPSLIQLEEGESAVFFLDQNEEIVAAEDQAAYQKRKEKSDWIILLVCLAAGSGIIAAVSILPRKAGKTYFAWEKASGRKTS